MARVTDGNEYFLNQYLSKEEKDERRAELEEAELEAEDKVFSGEEILDIIEGDGYERALVSLEEVAKKYPNSGAKEAVNYINKALEKDGSYTVSGYIRKLAISLFRESGYYFDGKWLITQELPEEDVLDEFVEIAYQFISEEEEPDFTEVVKFYTTAVELGDLVYGLPEEFKNRAYYDIRKERLSYARTVLEESGIGSKLINRLSPTDYYKVLTANTKQVGTKVKRLQVSDEVARDVQLAFRVRANDEDVYRTYAEVYCLFNNRTNSKNFSSVVNALNEGIQARESEGHIKNGFNTYRKWNLGVRNTFNRIVIFYTDELEVIVSNSVLVYRRTANDRGAYKISFAKPVYKVLKGDIRKCVELFN